MKLSKNGFLIISLLILLIAGQSGCTSTKPKPNLSSALIQFDNTQELKVAVIPADNIPHIKCIAYDKGRGRAAAKGASELGKDGAIGGLTLPIYALWECNDPCAGALIFVGLPVLIPACGLAGAVLGSSAGAISGAVKGDYREIPMEEEGSMANFANNASAMMGLNKALAEHLSKMGQDLTNSNYTTLNIGDVNNDFDVILKVGITSLIFKGEIERDPDMSFETEVYVEATDSTEKVLSSDIYHFVSNEISLSKWNKKKGQPLHKEINRCYQDISKRIIIDMFSLNE